MLSMFKRKPTPVVVEDLEEKNGYPNTPFGEICTLTPKLFTEDLQSLIDIFLEEKGGFYNGGSLQAKPRLMQDIFGCGAIVQVEHIDDERMYWLSKCYLKYKTDRHSHWDAACTVVNHWEAKPLFVNRYKNILGGPV